VSWNIGETTVAATITRPNDKAVHPGIVFVPGSGPTDRDWNTPLLPGTNGSAKLLAAELAKQGYVTIRYDKRFTGPNAQKNLPFLTGKISFESHLEELSGAVNQLLSRADVDPKRIYVVANSEGTLHSTKFQLEKTPPFAGLVLIGMPGRNMADVMHSQIEAQVDSLPNAKEIMAGYDQMMADFLAGKPFTANPAVPEGISNLMQSLYAPMNLPFTRELFSTDAAPLLAKIDAPVLVMIGKKDIQVDWQADGSVLEKAAQGKTNVTFSYPENANHVLKNEPKPRSELTAADGATYNAADKVLDADALKIIEEWLANQAQ
jgi:pimeloyl-ACP methyl ester carboxylesterase